MFDIYVKTIKILGYPQEFDCNDLRNYSINELSGIIAQTDSEADPKGFFAECDRIDSVIESLGIEI